MRQCGQTQAGSQREESLSQSPPPRPWSLLLGNPVSGPLPEPFCTRTGSRYPRAGLYWNGEFAYVLYCTHFSALSVLASQSNWELMEGSFKVIYAGHKQSPTHGTWPWHSMVHSTQFTLSNPPPPARLPPVLTARTAMRKSKLHPMEEVL